MSGALFGTIVLAAFLGGVAALLAPCCVSVMLPAYLATGMRHRGGVVPAVIVFGTGVTAVILPIGLGASAVSQVLLAQHTVIFLVGGVLTVLAGVATATGWMVGLPMPAARGRARRDGLGSVFALGAFSGAASACCAPVLAGIAILSGAAGSYPVALSVSLSYVAGMVAPLGLAAWAWDRRHARVARREISTGTPDARRDPRWDRRVSGLLLIAMGVLSGVVAFAGPEMPGDGWLTQLSTWLQHATSATTGALAGMPAQDFGLALITVSVVLMVRRALRAYRGRREPWWDDPARPTPPPLATRVDEDA